MRIWPLFWPFWMQCHLLVIFTQHPMIFSAYLSCCPCCTILQKHWSARSTPISRKLRILWSKTAATVLNSNRNTKISIFAFMKVKFPSATRAKISFIAHITTKTWRFRSPTAHRRRTNHPKIPTARKHSQMNPYLTALKISSKP